MQNLEKNLHPKELLKELGVREGMVVGDFGCGLRGTFTFTSAEIVGGRGVVYAVDIIKDTLKTIEGQAKIDGYEKIIKPIWSNLEKVGAITLADNSLDFGILVNTLFQNEHQNEILREAHRLLKEGGILFVADWLPHSPVAKTEIKYLVDQNKILQSANSFGFTLVKEFLPWDYHFGLVFRK
jgi:ubiquinone/menaquinone biosynthesis C-methylase UbiE